MKKIVVPIDFSEYSEFALQTAAMLAEKYTAKIYALHMLDVHEGNMSQSITNQQERSIFLLKIAEQKFEKFLDKDYLKNVTLIPVIKHYKVFSEVNAFAEQENADFIVMGSHGTNGIKGFFLGSNTEKVVRYASIPVLIVKNRLLNIDFKDVVIATDFSKESINTFKKVLKRLDFLNARKHLLYINLPDENFKTSTEMDKMANDFLMEVEGNVDRLINVNFVCEKSIEKGILNFSNAIGADLISVITHGRKGLSHIFAGSISEDVGNHSTLPVITFKM
jgi:nucleotide-binding universal stress UspA family protein